MTKDEALKQIIDLIQPVAALADGTPFEHSEVIQRCVDAVEIALEALAQPEQEPVARVIDNGTPEGSTEWIPFASRVEPLKTGDLLYTTPPQRPWVGLTDEDITKIDQGLYPTWKDEVQAVEAKLKEKNA